MESVSSGQASEWGKPSSATPVKAFSSDLAAAATVKPSVSDDILTPEKPAEARRRTKNRGVAYSLKEVRKIAASLQQPHAVSLDRNLKAVDVLPAEKDDAIGSSVDSVQNRLPSKCAPKLSQRCEILLEFFNSLTSSIRLLRLKGHAASFSKITRQVESLTNRRFSHGHLAQLKYILPEAICIKKILTHDETTSCVKPDLQVVLQTDLFEDASSDQKKGNVYHKLSQIFRSRLVKFSKEHSNEEEVPEAELPEPFNQARGSILPPPLPPPPQPMNLKPEAIAQGALPELLMPSHISSSCSRRFSRKEKDLAASSPYPPAGGSSSSSSTCVHKSPSDHMNAASEGTPSKLVSTPKSSMATPELQTPKRCQPDRRPTRTKLFHTPVKRSLPEEEEAAVSGAIQFLPKSLLQSIREKEKRKREEQEEGAAASKRRRKMLSCVPRLFNAVLLVFQSAKCSVITRQELVHKIVASQCDIVDRREVEEQLDLLLELVPDWISGKTASTGDFLFCINKASNPNALRRRLAEAE